MGMEAILKDELAAGNQYKSADDFYHARIKGHSYIVVDDKATEDEVAKLKLFFANKNREELDRLQLEYADQWA